MNSYPEIRPTIQSGQLVAFSHEDPMLKSWYDFKIGVVRMATKSEYSHVGVTWVVGQRVFILEAVMPLVRNFPLSKLGDFYYLPIPSVWTPEAEEYALSHIGDPYSQIKAMEAPFVELDEKDDLWECAEYANRIIIRCGINLGKIDTPTALVKEAQLLGTPCTLVKNS